MVINKCVACGGGCNGEYDHHCDPKQFDAEIAR